MRITNKTTSGEVWKHIKKLRNKPSSRTIVLKSETQNQYITDPKKVADTLAIHYARRSDGRYEDKKFNEHRIKQEKIPVMFSTDNEPKYNKNFTIEELKFSLSSCTSKSPGPDSLPYAFIQNFNHEQLNQLLNFFNYIYQEGYPHQWREGMIVPIQKPNKISTSCESYRPITLTNTLAKIMEKNG